MARIAEGWKHSWKRGIGRVRFRHEGQDYDLSTRSRDPSESQKIAAQLYSDIVSGRVKKAEGGALVHPTTPVDALCAEWIAAIESELGEKTDETYTTYARHWSASFKTVGGLTSAGVGDYQRARLKCVVRSTVVKERTALRRFMSWLVERKVLAEVPEFPKLSKTATGTRHKQGRRAPEGALSTSEVEAVLAKLPERGRGGLPVRAWFVALRETALRPATLRRVLPEHVTPFGLRIPAENDKRRKERVVPLTPAARWALGFAPFGAHDYRGSLAKAAKEALGPGRKVTPYDMKHSRVSQWFDEGAPETGIEFLTGTKQALPHYKHASRRAAETVLLGHSRAEPSGVLCEGRDLNPHESYPASTSIKCESGFTGVFGVGPEQKSATFCESDFVTWAGPNNSRAELFAAVSRQLEAMLAAHAAPVKVTLALELERVESPPAAPLVVELEAMACVALGEGEKGNASHG